MVSLDYGLICLARSLITGANVHDAKEKIFLYEQAVLLHNAASAEHVVYQTQYEDDLRKFTAQENQHRLAERSREVAEYASAALLRSQLIHERCEELDGLINDALSLGDGSSMRLRRKKEKDARR